jgi:hypothetical protein
MDITTEITQLLESGENEDLGVKGCFTAIKNYSTINKLIC